MPRRIALVTSSYAPHHGGVESHVREVAAQLHRRGHAVEVWTVDRGEHLGTRELDGIVVRDLPTPLPARSPGAVGRFAAAFPAAWRAWRSAFASFRPELLHVQCFGPNGLYAAGLAARTGVPLVVSSHGETFADAHDAFGVSALLPRGLRAAAARAVAVTGCSDVVAEELRQRFGAREVLVVPNGVDLDVELPPSRTLDLHAAADPEGPVVLGVGRLEHNKGFDLLLRSFADLPGRARLRLVGDGTERERLHALARELGVSERVTFTGGLDAAAVAGELAAADAVVVPSRQEAFGIVVLEAWRAGTPLVATSLGGPSGLVHHGRDGLLVDPTDRPALTDALARVVGDPALARSLAESGRRAVAGYTWAATADAYEALYDRAVPHPALHGRG